MGGLRPGPAARGPAAAHQPAPVPDHGVAADRARRGAFVRVAGGRRGWRAGGPGARVVARHEPTPDGAGTVVRLVLEQHGPLGVAVGALAARVTRRYLALETAGLKARCER